MTNIANIKIDKIRTGKYQFRTELENNEEIESLAESIKEEGLLHPIGVERLEDGFYDLMYGHRRLQAAILSNEKEIEAKIYEGLGEIGIREKCIIENFHRKDWNPNDKDRTIYATWKLGKESGKYKSVDDMAKKVSIPERSLRRIIIASEEKEKTENINNPVIQKATTRDLDRTKSLVKHPVLRQKVLELEQKKNDDGTQKLKALDLEKVTKSMESATINGISEETVMGVLNLVAKDKEIEPDKFNKIMDTIKQSPVDIQRKVLDNEISLEDAAIANMFPDVKQREAILTEVQAKKKMIAESDNKDIERHVNVRLKQVEMLKEGKVTPYKTEFDKFGESADEPNKVSKSDKFDNVSYKDADKVYAEEYDQLRTYVFRKLGNFNIKKMQNKKSKEYEYSKDCLRDIRDKINKIILDEESDTIIVLSEK